jgi:hypothetical protein
MVPVDNQEPGVAGQRRKKMKECPYCEGECQYNWRWQEISEATRFDAGSEFTSEEEVREYFTAESMMQMGLDPSNLDAMMADDVINHRWHCTF